MNVARHPGKRRHRNAFTLMELLVVMAIIAILAGIVLGALRFASIKSRRSMAEAELQAIASALQLYKDEMQYFPACHNFIDGTNTTVAFATSNSACLFRAISGNGAGTNTTVDTGTRPYFNKWREAKQGNIGKDTSSPAHYFIRDPWENPYNYIQPGLTNTVTFDLYSFGPDGKPGTEDDIAIGIR